VTREPPELDLAAQFAAMRTEQLELAAQLAAMRTEQRVGLEAIARKVDAANDAVFRARKELAAALREFLQAISLAYPAPAPADERLAALLRAADRMTEGDPFTSEGLDELAGSRFAGAAELRRAIDAVTGRRPNGGRRKLGHYLKAHARREAAGLRLVRLADARAPTYRIESSVGSEPDKPATCRPEGGR